jgi:ABC-type lipoprotein export system ATPase subunit
MGKTVSNGNLIELHNVIKRYKTEAGELPVLKDIDLTIGKGEFVGVIGKSGSGKSTLINMITGIDRPTSGEIFINNIGIHGLDEGKVAEFRGKNLGIVFQFFQLLPTLTVLENVMLPMDFSNMFFGQRRNRARELLDLVDVAEHANKLPSMLSGGQQQRVAIARSLSNNPPIIVADEPTGNLDSKSSEKVFQLFEKLVSDGKTILMVTHDSDQAKRMSRTLIISDGEIIEEYMARLFPALTDKQLVWATSKMKIQKFHPGEVIIKKGEKHGKLFMVTKGKVNIMVKSKGDNIVVAEYTKGQYFGEIELLRKNPLSVATARAGNLEVEVATLDRNSFLEILSKSKKLQEHFGRVAAERFKENVSFTKGA